jgi:hypothetical protein
VPQAGALGVIQHYCTEIPVTIGCTEILLPAVVWYRYSPIMRETALDPESGGVELVSISVHVSGLDIDIEWADPEFVDEICLEIMDDIERE